MGRMPIFPKSTNYKSPYMLPMAIPFIFVGMTKPKGSLTTKPSWTSPAHIQNLAAESLRKVTSQILAQTARAFPIKSQLV